MTSKLTQERQDRLCGLLAAGNFLEIACMLTPIGVATVYEWLSLGRGETVVYQRKGVAYVRHGTARHRHFAEAYARARAEAENRAVVTMGLAMQGNLVGERSTIAHGFKAGVDPLRCERWVRARAVGLANE
jgi:hypothetical protein